MLTLPQKRHGILQSFAHQQPVVSAHTTTFVSDATREAFYSAECSLISE
jgi:hypothetical protein